MSSTYLRRVWPVEVVLASRPPGFSGLSSKRRGSPNMSNDVRRDLGRIGRDVGRIGLCVGRSSGCRFLVWLGRSKSVGGP